MKKLLILISLFFLIPLNGQEFTYSGFVYDADQVGISNIQVELLLPCGRTLEERMMDADYTLLEYSLIQRKLVEKSYDKVHDFCVHEYKIDVKCVNTKYYSIPKEKIRNIPWMKKAFENNNLTHFAFYHMNRPLRPLEVDDKITFELLSLICSISLF